MVRQPTIKIRASENIIHQFHSSVTSNLPRRSQSPNTLDSGDNQEIKGDNKSFKLLSRPAPELRPSSKLTGLHWDVGHWVHKPGGQVCGVVMVGWDEVEETVCMVGRLVIFFLLHVLSFHSFNCVFGWTNIFNLNTVQFINLSLYY